MTGALPSAPVAPATEVPREYAAERPDHRSALIEGGEVAGVFVNRMMAEETKRFLARFPKKAGGGR